MRQPLGGLIPSFLNFSDCCIGSTLVWWEGRDETRRLSDSSSYKRRRRLISTHMASTSSSICLSNPPISV
jgi:hypothetical protein